MTLNIYFRLTRYEIKFFFNYVHKVIELIQEDDKGSI